MPGPAASFISEEGATVGHFIVPRMDVLFSEQYAGLQTPHCALHRAGNYFVPMAAVVVPRRDRLCQPMFAILIVSWLKWAIRGSHMRKGAWTECLSIEAELFENVQVLKTKLTYIATLHPHAWASFNSVNPPFQLLIIANGLQINIHLLEHHFHGEGLRDCKLVRTGGRELPRLTLSSCSCSLSQLTRAPSASS